jgi:hypothetical protein
MSASSLAVHIAVSFVSASTPGNYATGKRRHDLPVIAKEDSGDPTSGRAGAGKDVDARISQPSWISCCVIAVAADGHDVIGKRQRTDVT